jgi:hypothetical protein
MTIIRVSPSGPELVYPISDIGKVLKVDPDGTVKPKAVSLPSFLVETPIPRNSGTATIATQVDGIPALPLDVAPNSLVSLAVDVQSGSSGVSGSRFALVACVRRQRENSERRCSFRTI